MKNTKFERYNEALLIKLDRFGEACARRVEALLTRNTEKAEYIEHMEIEPLSKQISYLASILYLIVNPNQV